MCILPARIAFPLACGGHCPPPTGLAALSWPPFVLLGYPALKHPGSPSGLPSPLTRPCGVNGSLCTDFPSILQLLRRETLESPWLFFLTPNIQSTSKSCRLVLQGRVGTQQLLTFSAAVASLDTATGSLFPLLLLTLPVVYSPHKSQREPFKMLDCVELLVQTVQQLPIPLRI